MQKSITFLLSLETAFFLVFSALYVGSLIEEDIIWVSIFCFFVFGVHLTLLASLPNMGVTSMPFLYASSMALYMLSPYILYLSLGNLGLIYFREIELSFLARCLPLVMIAIVAFSFGTVWGHAPDGARSVPNHNLWARRHLEAMSSLVALGLMLFSVLIILKETASGGGLMPMLTGDYHAYSDLRKEGSQSRLFVASMTWFLPIASLTYNAIQKRRHRKLGHSDVLFALMMLFPLISGDRGGLIASFSGWLVIHQAVCRNVTAWKLFLVAGAILIFIPAMEILRNLSVSDWSFALMFETAADLSNNERFAGSTLLSFLGPFSPSMMTTMGTLMRVEGGEPLRLGTDYIGNILASVPLNSGAAPNNSGQIHDYLIPGRKGGPGFMALAEMYINLHIWGVAVGHALIGYVTSRLHQKLLNGSASAHLLGFAGVFFFTLLIWIRNEFSFVSQICFLWVVLFWFLPDGLRRIVPWHSSSRTAYG